MTLDRANAWAQGVLDRVTDYTDRIIGVVSDFLCIPMVTLVGCACLAIIPLGVFISFVVWTIMHS